MSKNKTNVSFSLPDSVLKALTLLRKKGYPTYVVGGALRDYLLSVKPHDFDLATSATPEEIHSVFQAFGIYAKSFRHDTVNVHFPDQDIEITSFRGVDIEEDLKLRDFTLDALAYSPEEGLIDPLGGREDLSGRILRCAYLPKDDFKDDPLRILRAIRIAGKYHLTIEEKTSSALSRYANYLSSVAPERIQEEFLKIIVLKDSDEWIRRYPEVFFTFIPELERMQGFNQRSPYHEFDLLEHTLHVLKAVKDRNPALCTAALFHDVGKPDCFFVRDGIGHFYGHAEKGEEITRKILTRLKCSTDFIEEVAALVKWHMVEIREKKTVKRLMNKLTPPICYEVIELREADIKGCTSHPPSKIPYVEALKKTYQEILTKKEPFSLKDLKINGNDLIALGLKPGKEIGDILSQLLSEVEEGKLENTNEVLTDRAKELIKALETTSK